MSISLLLYILAGVIVVLLIWIGMFEYRLRKFFAGKKARDLEEVMILLGKQMEKLEDSQTKINKHLATVDSRLDKSIRSVETIRFNPFDDAGSNQSFAIGMLNDEGDGVVISSLYARDRMSIFAKPIKNGTSEFELSNEEKVVLKKAK